MLDFIIDLNRETIPFPHYWEGCVGSCHAATALRQDWREHLKKCRDELGFKRVRFHGLLNDDMSIYKKDANGKACYSFYNADTSYSLFSFLDLSLNSPGVVDVCFLNVLKKLILLL